MGKQQKTHHNKHLHARKAALEGLFTVFNKKQQPEGTFAKLSANLSPRDKAFAYTLLQETLRHTLWLDAQIQAQMQKPFPAESMQQQILRLGLCQLLILGGIKPYAAINTSVELIKMYKFHKYSGVVNGVLRHIARTHEKTPLKLNAASALPIWLQKKLHQLTPHTQLEALAPALLKPATVDFYTYGPSPTTAEATPLSFENSYRLKEGTALNVLETQLHTQTAYIQDHSAQWPAYLLAKHLPKKFTAKNTPILDMCAAPGGKTRQLLALLPKNEIIAADRNPNRLETLKENIAKQTKKPSIMLADGAKPYVANNSLAAVLLDAPCSATGTIRRHPEVMHLRTPKDIKHLCTLQQEMLQKASDALMPEGILTYAVCSLLYDEGEAQDLWVKKHIPTLKPIKITMPPAMPQHLKSKSTWQPTENALRLTPIDGFGDGFYIALYQKIAL